MGQSMTIIMTIIKHTWRNANRGMVGIFSCWTKSALIHRNLSTFLAGLVIQTVSLVRPDEIIAEYPITLSSHGILREIPNHTAAGAIFRK